MTENFYFFYARLYLQPRIAGPTVTEPGVLKNTEEETEIASSSEEPSGIHPAAVEVVQPVSEAKDTTTEEKREPECQMQSQNISQTKY